MTCSKTPSPNEISILVKILLDTNALIWWLKDDPKLGAKARAMLADDRHEVMASIVSLWEIAIKWRIGKLEHQGSAFADLLAGEDIALVTIKPEHFAVLEALPTHHKDPFDHLILAQAKSEGAIIVTSDGDMAKYGIPCVPTS
jgi:PIN domain nuclease of toxin-antitoxin system